MTNPLFIRTISLCYKPRYVPWKEEIVTNPPVIENGVLQVPTGPGWGSELDEKIIAAHPPK